MANAILTLTFTGDIRVRAGCVYCAAIGLSSASGTIIRSPMSLLGGIAIGMGQQTASAFPLSDPAAPVTLTTNVCPVFAFGVR